MLEDKIEDTYDKGIPQFFYFRCNLVEYDYIFLFIFYKVFYLKDMTKGYLII
ncbi:hypothetical protein SDC9_162492 [bioreactor metagenome]|uniref:Uncharacterized protein n=1 Tax=bioreactor metagenome TaxID=1076179 RepID=A0A645FSV4_9ZZZZ